MHTFLSTRFFFYCYGDHRALHSFPTRRSSDLVGDGTRTATLPMGSRAAASHKPGSAGPRADAATTSLPRVVRTTHTFPARSEEHTSELQSRLHLVCRLLLEKKKNKKQNQSC